jgi:Tfp pilus assembly protein PilN
MINLLPPELKENYRFARRNTVLRRWIFVFAFALIGLTAISAGGNFYLQKTANDINKQNDIAQASLDAQDMAGTEKQVKDINNNIKLSIQVLSKEILFSKLLKQMGTIIPNNVILSNININDQQTALDISAQSVDYASATQLQVNLTDPANKLFNKADIVSIACAKPDSGSSSDASSLNAKYPCTVSIRALFNSDNPYLFINNSKKAAKP